MLAGFHSLTPQGIVGALKTCLERTIPTKLSQTMGKRSPLVIQAVSFGSIE